MNDDRVEPTQEETERVARAVTDAGRQITSIGRRLGKTFEDTPPALRRTVEQAYIAGVVHIMLTGVDLAHGREPFKAWMQEVLAGVLSQDNPARPPDEK